MSGCRGWVYEQLIFVELLTFVVEAILVMRRTLFTWLSASSPYSYPISLRSLQPEQSDSLGDYPRLHRRGRADGRVRRRVAIAVVKAEMGNKLVNVSSTEAHPQRDIGGCCPG